jgi:hypothetical protein
MSNTTIPKGFVMDAKGNLLNKANLTPFQREEDNLCNALFVKAQTIQTAMAMFKHESMSMVEEVLERCLKEHGIKKFAKIKGNVQFTSIDGLIKIQRSIDDRIEVNAISEVARQLISQYKQTIEQNAGEDAKAWIDTTFEGKDGNLSVSKVVDFMNKDIDHPLYRQAVDALRKSLFVNGSKAYLRFYFREDSDDQWQALPLQFSSIDSVAPPVDQEQQSENKETKETAA